MIHNGPLFNDTYYVSETHQFQPFEFKVIASYGYKYVRRGEKRKKVTVLKKNFSYHRSMGSELYYRP